MVKAKEDIDNTNSDWKFFSYICIRFHKLSFAASITAVSGAFSSVLQGLGGFPGRHGPVRSATSLAETPTPPKSIPWNASFIAPLHNEIPRPAQVETKSQKFRKPSWPFPHNLSSLLRQPAHELSTESHRSLSPAAARAPARLRLSPRSR